MTTFIVIGLYTAVMLAIGLYSAGKANTVTAFVIGGRSVGAWLSGFAYGTTYFSAVIFIGYAGRNGWQFGLLGVLIGLGNMILGSYLPWKLFAEPIRRLTTKHNVSTMPAFFDVRYDSKAMRLIAACIIFIFLIPYSASVYSGIGYLCEHVLNIDYTLCMIIIATLTAFYLVLGGYVATLIADFIQGILMIGGLVLMVIFVSKAEVFGGGGILGALSASIASTKENVNIFDFSQPANALFLGAQIFLTSIGVWAMPQAVHKFYAIKDKAAIKKAAIISTAFAGLVAVVAYFVGSLAPMILGYELPMLGGAPHFDAIIPIILKQLLPEVLLAGILVLILAASMSTLSSLVISSASAISIDLLGGVFHKDISPKRQLLVTRILCLIFIIISLILAMTKTPILTLMSFSWGAIAGSFMGPFLLGVFCKSITKAGAFSGLIGGCSFTVICCVVSGFESSLAPIFGMFAMILSVILTLAVSRFTRPYDKEKVEEFFA